jgi:hypothetical protein
MRPAGLGSGREVAAHHWELLHSVLCCCPGACPFGASAPKSCAALHVLSKCRRELLLVRWTGAGAAGAAESKCCPGVEVLGEAVQVTAHAVQQVGIRCRPSLDVSLCWPNG